jgi:hypothetical protein
MVGERGACPWELPLPKLVWEVLVFQVRSIWTIHRYPTGHRRFTGLETLKLRE